MAQLKILHHLWRKLPRSLRQRVFHELLVLGVPRPAPIQPGRPLEPVVVAGVLRAATGLGQAARLAVHALRAEKVDVRTFDLTEALRQTPTETFDLGATAQEGGGTLLLFATPPTVPLALRTMGRRLLAHKFRIGGWVCETEYLPELWREQARWLHAIAAPSSFSQRAIARATGRPAHLLVHPVEAEPWPVAESARRRQSVVGAMLDVGSSAARKNVSAITELCRLLLAHDAEVQLVLKVRDLTSDNAAAGALRALVQSANGRVELHAGDWSRDATIAFLDRLDLMISLSRAEGFGLPIAEAMRRGIAVAAPFYAGPADYLDGSNAISLPFTLVDIADASGLYGPRQGRWAEVDVSASVEIVAGAVRNGPALDRLIAQARSRSRALFTSDQFVAQLRAIGAGERFGG